MIQAVGRWEVFDLASAFATWREEAASARERRELAAAAVERWRLWRVWAAWEVWREVVERRHEDKTVMRRVSFDWLIKGLNFPVTFAYHSCSDWHFPAIGEKGDVLNAKLLITSRKPVPRFDRTGLSVDGLFFLINREARRGTETKIRCKWAIVLLLLKNANRY